MFEIFANGELIFQPAVNDLRLISPKLTLEMGKAGSLEFGVPSVNKYYTTLEQLRTVLTVTDDTGEIFRGRVLNNKKNFSNVRTIYGEGDLAYLVDSVQEAKKYTGKAHALFRNIIAAHNQMVQDPNKQFTVGTITVEDRDVLLTGKSEEEQDIYEDAETKKFNVQQVAINSIAEEWQNTFDYIQNCLIEYCGGYLRSRRVGNVTYIDWLKDYFSTTTQTIEYGRNLLDLTEEVNIEEAFSVLIPLGDENLTVKDAADYNAGGVTHTKGSKEIVDTAAVAKYGRILKTNVFDGVTNAATLLENGVRYLKTNSTVPVTLEITAVDLHLINPNVQKISLGDRVHISSPGHSIDYTGDEYLICTKIEYDLNNPGNTRYTFGNPKQTLTERYRKDKRKQDEQSARSGGGGGGGGGKAAKENADSDSLDVYRSWFKFNENTATIDFGTLFQHLYPGTTTAEYSGQTELIMDSNPNHGKINLWAEHIRHKNTEEILKARCGIDFDSYTYVDDTGQISGQASTTISSIFEDSKKETQAQIELTSNALRSEIALKADQVTVDADLFQINARVGENRETIVSISKDLTTLSSKVTRIDSDLTEIRGAVHVGSTLTVDRALTAPVITGILFTKEGGGTYGVGTHSHSIEVSGDKIYIGTADWGNKRNSFSIADTKFYKDKVKALTVKSLTPTITTNTTNFTVTMKAVNADGKVLSERSVTTSAAVYNNGVAAGEKNVGVDTIEYVPARRGIRIYLSNGKAPFYSGYGPL